MTLQFEPQRSPLVVADVDSHEALGVERSPADEERDDYSNCDHITQHTHIHTPGCSRHRLRSVRITYLISSHLISFRPNSALRLGRCSHGELGRLTAHDPVRRDCDQPQRTQFS